MSVILEGVDEYKIIIYEQLQHDFLHSGYFVSAPVCSHWTFSGVQFKVLWVEFLILRGCMLIQKRQQPLTQFEFFCKNIIALFPGVGKYGNQLNEFV